MAEEAGIKIICENRKAFHNFLIEDRYEAGMVLKGTEVKALRNGKANIRDAYAVFKGSELYLINAHINIYEHGNRANHEPEATRKLLLNRAELNKIWGRSEVSGYSLVALKMYFKNGIAKIEIGIGRGKKDHDKRASTKEKEAKRDLQRIIKKNR